MTDPNAEEPRPAVDPWADTSDADPWAADVPTPPVAASPAPAAGAGAYSPGHAAVPAAPSYAATEVYPPPTAPPYSAPPTYGYPPQPGGGRGLPAAVIVGVLVLVLVAAGVYVLPKVLKQSPGGGGPTTAATSPPQTSPTATATATPPLDLFAGTPAADFKSGADAIVLPTPVAVDGFSSDDVRAALDQVKKAMVAARLSPKMLVDHDPSEFVSLLAPDGRAQIQANFTNKDAFPYATRLRDGTQLADVPIRASGGFTVSGQVVDNIQAVVIVSDFVWVYPIVAHRSGTGADLVVVRDRITWVVYKASRVEQASVGLWVKRARAFGSNLDCRVVQDDDLVVLAATPVTEDRTEGGNVYNLDPALNFDKVNFVC